MAKRPIYEEVVGDTILVEYEEYEIEHPSYLVIGLADVGLVGSISANHLASSLKLEEVGGVDIASMMPPIAVVHKGEIRPPFRLYAGKNLIVLSAEAPPPPSSIPAFSQLLIDYAMKKGIDYVVSLMGLASPRRMEVEEPKVYWVASNEKAKRLVEGIGKMLMLESGYIVGPYALILKYAIRRRVANLILMAESFVEFPDPEAAATLLKHLSTITGVEIDTEALLKEAELIRLKLRGLMKKTRQTMAEMGAPSPTMYA